MREQIKELRRKGKIAANAVWGLGERVCRDDFPRRWMLFNYLVRSVMVYGAEIWGWTEQRELEKIMLDYVRWVFRFLYATVYPENKARVREVKSTVGYTHKVLQGKNKGGKGDEVYRCWREKQMEGWKDMYGQERERYYNRNGWRTVAVDGMAEEERDLKRELVAREREAQRQEDSGFIDKARYNARYRVIREEGRLPRYLEQMHYRSASGEGIRALLRVRCGNMEEGFKYWLGDEAKQCIFCETDMDTLEDTLC